KVLHINAPGVEDMLKRSMQLQCNIQEGEIYLSDDSASHTIIVNER
ncbi:MAG: hypothetical protein GQ582_06770, partial [Methyloprofundus sp.]|nr:hypothetical protein [Methyloprofundus sp.]